MILPNGEELSPGIVPVVLTPDYYIGLERHDNLTFVHGTVFSHWGTHLAREIRDKLDRLSDLHDGPLIAASHRPHNGDFAKFGKFARMMGFTFFRTVRGTDGADYAVFVRWR